MLPDTDSDRLISVSIVTMLPLLLVPLVISGFFLVNTLVDLALAAIVYKLTFFPARSRCL